MIQIADNLLPTEKTLAVPHISDLAAMERKLWEPVESWDAAWIDLGGEG